MEEDIKVTNSNPDIIELDFKDLDFKSKYEVLKLKAREAGPLLGKYIAKVTKFEDRSEFIGSLSFDDYLEILKNTKRDGVFITEHNYDEFFENDVSEPFAVILKSLETHAQYSQKKSSGIKENSNPVKILD